MQTGSTCSCELGCRCAPRQAQTERGLEARGLVQVTCLIQHNTALGNALVNVLIEYGTGACKTALRGLPPPPPPHPSGSDDRSASPRRSSYFLRKPFLRKTLGRCREATPPGRSTYFPLRHSQFTNKEFGSRRVCLRHILNRCSVVTPRSQGAI